MGELAYLIISFFGGLIRLLFLLRLRFAVEWPCHMSRWRHIFRFLESQPELSQFVSDFVQRLSSKIANSH